MKFVKNQSTKLKNSHSIGILTQVGHWQFSFLEISYRDYQFPVLVPNAESNC